MKTFGSSIFLGLAWLACTGCNLWAAGALAFDAPFPWLKGWIGFILYLLAALIICMAVRGRATRILASFALFLVTLGWWLTLQPSNTRPWQPDVAKTPYAEISGDTLVIHNVRHCNYRTEHDYTVGWETRSYALSELQGVDIAINYWGSPYMAHPIMCFQFANGLPLAISIETRKEVGETYSAIGGIYRQFELIYIAADERDLIRVRTNFRTGEDVYLMRTKLPPEHARKFLLQYVDSMNQLHRTPRWYNAITTNCTTSIRAQRPLAERRPWDWRILVNGLADQMLHENNALATGGLSFAEYKARTRINDKANALGDDHAFSSLLRIGLPGFGP